MRQMHEERGWQGTGEPPEWARKILAADPDTYIDDELVYTLHRPGETRAEYQARAAAAAPPLNDEQETAFRAAAAEYWSRREA